MMEVDVIKHFVIQSLTQKCTVVYTATQVCKMLHTVVQYNLHYPNSCVQNDYLDSVLITAKLINIYPNKTVF